jgi:hypothetical protein
VGTGTGKLCLQSSSEVISRNHLRLLAGGGLDYLCANGQPYKWPRIGYDGASTQTEKLVTTLCLGECGSLIAKNDTIEALDSGWRTIAQIRSVLGTLRYDPELTGTLRNLAEYGKIERKVQKTGAPLRVRRNKPALEREIEFYRLPNG